MIPASLKWRDPLRVTAGGMVAFATAEIAGLPEATWSVMTALIVMRAPAGRTLHAGRDRLLGTLLGAAIALLLVSLRVLRFPDLALIGLVLAATSCLVVWRPTLGAAPIAAIIVISSAGGHSPLHVAVLRVLEIAIGAVVGDAACRVLPRGPAGSRAPVGPPR
jgi:uncharacterized membrane protein YccC